MKAKLFFLSFLLAHMVFCQSITITVDVKQKLNNISPWIYGRNNNLSDLGGNPMPESNWTLYKDAGLRMFRENGGNNATKYNWKKKLSSHPDWYNNVYAHDWDYAASSLLNETKDTQGLFAFQLIGKVASATDHNFADWCYNQSQWWTGVQNNWAGGGGPSCGTYVGNNGEGNPDLYLKDWPHDSTVSILDHWFNDLKLDSTRLRYWNMDNEPELWAGTHDDIIPAQATAEEFIQKYFAVAKAARKKFPGIKLVGPVVSNEWFWYNWFNGRIQDPNNASVYYSWSEYFIKRVGEEQKATGIRLLDVFDAHFYPDTESDAATTLQLHRVWFDTTYNFPKANGVKVLGSSGWDNSIQKEYYFHRVNQWLKKYLGEAHGVRLAVTEYGAIYHNDPNVVACWYASHLGLFAERGIEIFTPWNWYVGQWEVLHLFSHYFGTQTVKTTSGSDDVVSAYSSLSANGDSLMIAIINKDRNASRDVTIQLKNTASSASTINGFQLSNLPANETFVSRQSNALQAKTFQALGNTLSLSVPKLSVTLIRVPLLAGVTSTEKSPVHSESIYIYPNPTKQTLRIRLEQPGTASIIITDMVGRTFEKKMITSEDEVDISSLQQGPYLLQARTGSRVYTAKFIKE